MTDANGLPCREPVLSYPHHGVFGTADFPKLAAFLALFGLQAWQAPSLSAASADSLYGVGHAVRQWMLASPTSLGLVRAVQTPNAPHRRSPFDRGAYGIDFYSMDLRLTLEIARAAGAEVSPVISYRVDGKSRLEARISGPEGFSVFIVESDEHRFPSVLDHEFRTHSEMCMLVWVIGNAAEEVSFWTGEAGLRVVRKVSLDTEAMVGLMGHPHPTRLDAIHVADEAVHRRIELLHYPDEPAPMRADGALRAGLHAVAFVVPDLEAAMEALPSATFGESSNADLGTGPHRAVTGMSPGGVRFELWQPAAA